MLIRLTVANFLSFKEEIEFTTLATRERQHSDRVFTDKEIGLKLLPVSAIFGGNASGKSNFYYAVEFLRRLVLRSPTSPDEQIPVEPFKLDDGVSETLPSRFSIEILPSTTAYRLTLAVLPNRIAEEKLEEIRGERSILIYSREHLGDQAEPTWDVTPLQRRAESAADREFIGFKTRDTLANQLFLSAVRGKNVPVADEVSTWFREQLALVLPTSTFKMLEFSLPSERGLQEYCNDSLRKADTGIFEIGQQKISWDAFPVPTNLKENLKKMLGEGQVTFVLGPDGRRYSVSRKDGELQVAHLYTMHKTASGRRVRFELADESQGTQRFVDLLPAFYELARSNRPKVFVIDEVDRSLHTRLTRHLIESYLRSLGPDSRCQLIFTTHDALLLDQELLRRDEIWFMEKTEDGSSTMTSLADFEGVRYDRDILKSYLLGTYGGLPRVSGLPTRRSIEAIPAEG